MSDYQVIARKYRPKTFKEVIGQESIVTTLKNAIKNQRLAHAYLFCGSRGTGKTTLARVFAKALNCQSPTVDGEPCCQCHSCREIAVGSSLDVIEIDGASHRGIDDIRQINETVGYAAAGGKYKIYIIDEVHMLTKEAFNALLKTLEEPPAKVMFLFATTEPHKVLPTILSRCQRFNLNRIPNGKIIEKLRKIAEELKVDVDDGALRLLAHRADGGLRDAESLFDQIIAFYDGKITESTIADVLGLMPKDALFNIDHAGKEGRLYVAFEIAHQVFSQGKDQSHFVESLTEHFRTLLLIKLAGSNAAFLDLLEADRAAYEDSAKLYTQEQCVTILEYLIEAQSQIRFQASGRIALESILLHIMRTHQRVPVEFLVRRLSELEESLKTEKKPSLASTPAAATQQVPISAPKQAIVPSAPQQVARTQQMIEDPTPTPMDLGIRGSSKKESNSTPSQSASPMLKSEITKQPEPLKQEIIKKEASPELSKPIDMLKQSRYDTLMQFAAVELEGTVQKK